MTPAARVAASIEILDAILDGTAGEQALTGWGRRHRFAGSKDRAAIRDHVFQALRARSSYAWTGGAETGRGIMIGAVRALGREADVFTGEGYAPAAIGDDEQGQPIEQAPRSVQRDMPEWLLAHFDGALGDDADEVLGLLTARAGVFVRVNPLRGSNDDAVASLAAEGIVTVPVNGVKNALQVTDNERRIAQSDAYLSGLVELQDPSSQSAIAALGIAAGRRVLDLCAGGGGKALAMAASGAKVFAHDIDPRRMTDIPARAQRAGVEITMTPTAQLPEMGPFDLVLVDAPCSGSGTWRRSPAAKWDLTPDRLRHLTEVQDGVLDQAAQLVGAGGRLIYATCSVFDCENGDRIQAFVDRSSGYRIDQQVATRPHAQGDGFFFAVLSRAG